MFPIIIFDAIESTVSGWNKEDKRSRRCGPDGIGYLIAIVCHVEGFGPDPRVRSESFTRTRSSDVHGPLTKSKCCNPTNVFGLPAAMLFHHTRTTLRRPASSVCARRATFVRAFSASTTSRGHYETLAVPRGASKSQIKARILPARDSRYP